MVDYRIKAKPIEFMADATWQKIAGYYARRAWNWLTWRVSVLLRLRSR